MRLVKNCEPDIPNQYRLLTFVILRFTVGKPYWMVPFAIFIGFFIPIPFWLLYRFSTKGSKIAKFAEYINTPILTLYIGYLPYSVNGQWWYVQPPR